jgi:NhaP-type Na+/H+ or K+/H+ antiporter
MALDFDPSAFVSVLAAIGAVIIVATLISGLLDRRSLPAVGVFLLLGLAVGPMGLNLLDVGLRSAALGIITTVALALVLFTDALGIDPRQLRSNARLAALVLGPGTVLSTLTIGVAAWYLLGLSPALAAILGAALASTDPVMVRGLLRRPGVPAPARVALSVESGLNDVVVLPVILVAIAFLGTEAPGIREIGAVGISVFVLGPLIGGLVGYLAVQTLEWIRPRTGLRRDYESLYVLGVAFAAYAAAETVHASGFMAAFTAGLVIALLDVSLCDCFHDYGEATSEMFLLFTFVALGTSLIWEGLTVVTGATVGFAVVALFARSVVLWPALRASRLDAESRRYVTWFGPRALSSLLLVLLPVFAGVAEAEQLFPLVAMVTLGSVLVHGTMLMAWQRRLGARGPTEEPELTTIAEYRELVGKGAAIRLLDVRAGASWDEASLTASGAARLDPDRPVESAAALALPHNDWLIAFCA